MRKLLLAIITTSLIHPAFAQFSKENNIALGDKSFRNKDYYEAAHYYRKAAEGIDTTITNVPYQASEKVVKKAKVNKSRAYLVFQLAESYRLYENYIEAEGWYGRIAGTADEVKYPLARLWHGVCQRATQKFDAAINELEYFTKNYKGDVKYLILAKKEIANCRFAKYQYKNPAAVDIVKAKSDWNTDGSSYAVMKYSGNYWFTSSRLIEGDKARLNRIYGAGTGNVTPEIVSFKEEKDGPKEVEYGTPSFDPTGKRLYFTRWYKQGGKITCDVYMIQVGTDGLSGMKKLNSNVNTEGHHSKQPFVSSDGKQLYFVSNKPGGYGGDDIWVSDLNGDGSPLNSTNLGSTINTEFDEQAPYYNSEKQKLIYSSKGFTGLGGFDFFESSNASGQWSVPQNMGYPFNSAKDDLYFFPDDENSNKFYFSSDRESDCCLNIFEGYDRRSTLSGSVSDCATNEPLAGVRVSFIDSLTKKIIGDTLTNNKGVYAMAGMTGNVYSIRLEKQGYFTKVLAAKPSARTGNDTLFNGDICLQPFQVDKPIVIQNVWYDYNEATLRPESKIVLDELAEIMLNNPKLLVELAAHTDSKGKDAYNDALSLARAKACVTYIVSKGVSESQVYAKGYGERRPVAPNTLPNGKDNPEGRQLNRRTEFTVKKIE